MLNPGLTQVYKQFESNNLLTNGVKRKNIDLSDQDKKPKMAYDKNPRSLLNEIRPDIQFNEVPNTSYAFFANVDDKYYEASGISKKLAKTNLAQKILIEHLHQMLDTKTNKSFHNYSEVDLKIKNPISLLNELSCGKHLNFDINMDISSKTPLFIASLVIDEITFTAQASSKSKAKFNLSKNILYQLYNIKFNDNHNETSISLNESLNDQDYSFNANIPSTPEDILSLKPIKKTKILLSKPYSAILNELIRYDTIYEISTTKLNSITATIKFNGKEFKEEGSSKKSAKNSAAEKALKYLNIDYDIPLIHDTIQNESGLNFMESDINSESTPELKCNKFYRSVPTEFADFLALKVLEKYKTIMELSPIYKTMFENSKMIVGILMLKQTTCNVPAVKLIAASNCTRCFDVPAIAEIIGNPLSVDGFDNILTDCHAEVLCRKALQKFLIRQLSNFQITQTKENEKNIFEEVNKTEESGRAYKLKDDIKFILYTSGFPCSSETKNPYQNAKSVLEKQLNKPMNKLKSLQNGSVADTTTNQDEKSLDDSRNILTVCPGIYKSRGSDRLLVKSFYSFYHVNENRTPDLDDSFLTEEDELTCHTETTDKDKKSNYQEDGIMVSNTVVTDKDKKSVASFLNISRSANETLSVCNLLKDKNQELLSHQLNHGIGIMSCADKLMLWNVIGVQGRQLTQILEPIYFTGVITSTPYPIENLYRTIYGRSLHFLRPNNFKSEDVYLNKPILQKTTFKFVPPKIRLHQRDKKYLNFPQSPLEQSRDDPLHKDAVDKVEEDDTVIATSKTTALCENYDKKYTSEDGLPVLNDLRDELTGHVNKPQLDKKLNQGKNPFTGTRLPNFLKNSRYGFVWYVENEEEVAGHDVLEILDANQGMALSLGEVMDLAPLSTKISESKARYTSLLETVKATRSALAVFRSTLKTLSTLEQSCSESGAKTENKGVFVGSNDGVDDDPENEKKQLFIDIEEIKESPTTTSTDDKSISSQVFDAKALELETKLVEAQNNLVHNVDETRMLYRNLQESLNRVKTVPSSLLDIPFEAVINKCGSTVSEVLDSYITTKDAFKYYCEHVLRIGSWMNLPKH